MASISLRFSHASFLPASLMPGCALLSALNLSERKTRVNDGWSVFENYVMVESHFASSSAMCEASEHRPGQ